MARPPWKVAMAGRVTTHSHDGGVLGSSLLTLIFLEIINVYKSEMAHRDNAPQHYLIAAILRYIEMNCETCTLTDTAGHFALNANYVRMAALFAGRVSKKA